MYKIKNTPYGKSYYHNAMTGMAVCENCKSKFQITKSAEDITLWEMKDLMKCCENPEPRWIGAYFIVEKEKKNEE